MVVFLDDAQLYAEVRKFLGILRNVLSDDELIAKSGYLFVLAATEQGWTEFLGRNNPIGRYFSPPVRVGAFNRAKTREIVDLTLRDSRVTFSPEVQNAVFEYTEGHPYQLQILCSYLYENQIRGRVGREQLDTALTQTLEEMGPLVLQPLLQDASENEGQVMKAICGIHYTFSFSDMQKAVRKAGIAVAHGPLATMAARLTEKGLLVKVGRGQYRIASRLLAEFVARQ